MPSPMSRFASPLMLLVFAVASLGCKASNDTSAQPDAGQKPDTKRDAAMRDTTPDAGMRDAAVGGKDAGSVAGDAGSDTPVDAGGGGTPTPAVVMCPTGKMHCGKSCVTAIEPTFDEIYDRILVRSCVFASCHGGGSPKEGFDLRDVDTAFGFVGKPAKQMPELSMIEPGAPQNSYIIRKLRGMDFAPKSSTGGKTTVMPPPPQEVLCDGRIEVIETWIRDGAKR